MGVAIVGVGMHPFGRFDLTARSMATIAARAALDDAALSWTDVDFATGGSRDGGQADALVSDPTDPAEYGLDAWYGEAGMMVTPGIAPAYIDVAQLQDTEAGAELMHGRVRVL